MPKKSKKDELDERHIKALEALAAGGTDAEAANAAGVSVRTIQNWRGSHEPFRAQLSNRIRTRLESAGQSLDTAAVKAIDRLSWLMDSDDENVVLGAAKATLGHASFVKKTVEVKLPGSLSETSPAKIAAGAVAYMIEQGTEAKRAVLYELLRDGECQQLAREMLSIPRLSGEQEVLQGEFVE